MNKAQLYIAKSYLFSKKKQTFFSVLGVTFGVSMFIVMINFMTGVNKFLEDTAFQGTPDILITPKLEKNTTYQKIYNNANYVIYDYSSSPYNPVNKEKLSKYLSSVPDIFGFSLQLNTQVIYSSGNSIQVAGSLSGVNINSENKIYSLYKRMVGGSIENFNTAENGIIIGQHLAKKAKLKIGDLVYVTTISGEKTKLKITGIFSFGISLIDNAKAYVKLETLQRMLHVNNNTISEIHIKLKDSYNYEKIEHNLNNNFSVQTQNWKQINNAILTGVTIRNTLTWVISFALLLVAGFGIYNIMNISVIQKRRDISILKTIGFYKKEISNIFLLQAIFIGLVGAFLGVVLGFIICVILSNVPLEKNDFIDIQSYPMNFNPVFYILGALFGIITTIIAGYLPAKEAASVDPLVILRNL
jgi:lipoprotein-releasing system permease protein